MRNIGIFSLTELALDEGESLRTVNGHVLLVVVGVAAIAAVGVLRVTVGLDNGRAAGRASVAARARSKLDIILSALHGSVSLPLHSSPQKEPSTKK